MRQRREMVVWDLLRNTNFLVGTVVILANLMFLMQIKTLSMYDRHGGIGPGFLPFISVLIMLGTGLFFVYLGWQESIKGTQSAHTSATEYLRVTKVILLYASIFLCIVLMPLLKSLPSFCVLSILCMYLVNGHKFSLSMYVDSVVVLVIAWGIFYLFTGVLSVPLP